MALWNGKIVDTTTGAAPSDSDWVDEDAWVDEPTPPSAARAGVLGVAQGGTFGLSDEIGATLGQFFVPESGVRPGPEAPPELLKNRPTSYELIRDGMRKEQKAAEAAHPGVYDTAELAAGMAVPMPGGMLKGAAKVGRAALMGGVNAFGHAEGSAGEQALETLAGAGTGAALDKGMSALGSRIKGGKLSHWLGQLGTKADSDMLSAAQKTKDKAVRSAVGGLGGEAADIIRSQEVVEKMAAKLAESDPALAEKLRVAATDPAALERLKAAAENYVPRIKEGLSGFAAKEAELASAKAIDPAAEAAKRGLRSVLLSDKSKKYYLNRGIQAALPVVGSALGSAIGGDDHRAMGSIVGGLAGTVGALATGHGGTKVVNDLRSPEVRKAFSKVGQKALSALGSGVEKLARPSIMEATDQEPRALLEWLRSRRD